MQFLSRWNRGISNWWGSLLHRRFLQQPGSVALLTAKMREIKDTYATAQQVQTLIDSYSTTVRSQVSQAPDLARLPVIDASTPETKLAEYDVETARIASLVEANFQNFLATLERPMPVFMGASIVDGNVVFRWDESFDLQGDGITYDFELSTSTGFEPENIIVQRLGLTDPRFEQPVAALAWLGPEARRRGRGR